MIEGILSSIDSEVAGIAQTNFGALAGDIGGLIIPIGMLGFLLLTINMLFQVLPMNPGGYFIWAARFLLVTSAASSWAFFQPIYDAIIALPDGISGLLLGGDSLSGGIQATSDQLWDSYDALSSDAGFNVGMHITALLIALIAIGLTCAAILVIGIAKMGLAIGLGLAPIFIISLSFKSTQDLFAGWTKFILSFVMILVLTAGIIGVITTLLSQYSTGASGATGLQDMVGLLVIAISSIFFIIQVPSYAMALSGSMAVAGMSLASVARGATTAASAATGAAVGGATGAAAGAALTGAAMRGAKAASDDGASPGKAAREGARAFNATRVKAHTAGGTARIFDAAANSKGSKK